MADVRSLLRQQRAARRIVHPHATYSDAGKLLCTVCHELVKVESLWDGHIRSPSHLQRVQRLRASNSVADQSSASLKRKHDDETRDDMSMADDHENSWRTKRSRSEVYGTEPGHDTEANGKDGDKGGVMADKMTPTRTKPPTPPLPRRISGTPSHGVELQIPSRPATPVAARSEFIGANTRAAVSSHSPLLQQKEPSTFAGFVSTTSEPGGISTPHARAVTPPPPSDAALPGHKGVQDVDEDEWAAFEADLLRGNTNGTSTGAMLAAPADAVISAPAMTADELAAQRAEEERERRRATVDVELENEKEEATRALETEFEDMEELEARVRRLKERREALRRQQGSPLLTAAVGAGEGKSDAAADSKGKENAIEGDGQDGEQSDDDEDDEDVDDWAGFRLKGR